MRRALLTVVATALASLGTGTAAGAWASPDGGPISFDQRRPALTLDEGNGWTRDDMSERARGLATAAAAWTGMVAVDNVGVQPATYTLQVDPTSAAGPGTFGGALVVTARERPSGLVAYHGKLAGLHISSRSGLLPGHRTTYDLAVAWVNGPDDDNRLEGQSFHFRFRLSAAATIGS